jgi:hypothetical protein
VGVSIGNLKEGEGRRTYVAEADEEDGDWFWGGVGHLENVLVVTESLQVCGVR